MNFAEAFIAQARSDLDAHNELCRSPILPSCHRLHYLQMWLEKLCKAHAWTPDALPERKHGVVSKFLPMLVSHHWKAMGFAEKPNQGSLKKLARMVDLLHPSLDGAGRHPQNVEYPWPQRGSWQAPVYEHFELASQLATIDGIKFLKAAISLTHHPHLAPVQ
jgi:hypothetical protein